MSYHLQIPDMFQNALVIFAYFAALERQKQTEDERGAGSGERKKVFPRRKNKNFPLNKSH